MVMSILDWERSFKSGTRSMMIESPIKPKTSLRRNGTLDDFIKIDSYRDENFDEIGISKNEFTKILEEWHKIQNK